MDGTYGFNAARCSSWIIFSALTALIDGFDGLGTFSKTAYEEIPTSDTVNAHYHDIPTATWRITSYRLLTFILMILSCAAQRSLYFEHICYPSMGQMLLSQAITSMCNHGASSLTHWTFSVQSPIHLDPYYSFFSTVLTSSRNSFSLPSPTTPQSTSCNPRSLPRSSQACAQQDHSHTLLVIIHDFPLQVCSELRQLQVDVGTDPALQRWDRNRVVHGCGRGQSRKLRR
jgi:hypothetical protein